MGWFKKNKGTVFNRRNRSYKANNTTINTPNASYEVSTLSEPSYSSESENSNGFKYSSTSTGGPLVVGYTLIDRAPLPKTADDFDDEFSRLMHKTDRTSLEDARLERLVGISLDKSHHYSNTKIKNTEPLPETRDDLIYELDNLQKDPNSTSMKRARITRLLSILDDKKPLPDTEDGLVNEIEQLEKIPNPTLKQQLRISNLLKILRNESIYKEIGRLQQIPNPTSEEQSTMHRLLRGLIGIHTNNNNDPTNGGKRTHRKRKNKKSKKSKKTRKH